MARYKVTLEYDGTPFSGFQIQKNPELTTIQGELQRVLSKIFNHPIKIYAAGRTDTGVHALNQVIHFDSDKDFPTHKLITAMNGLLHKAIAVKKAEIVPGDFHARYSAVRREYVYVLDNSPAPSAFCRNRAYWYPHLLDLEKIREACSYYEGTHDFRLFVKGLKEIGNTVRTVERAEIYVVEDLKKYYWDEDFPINSIQKVIGSGRNLIFFYFRAQSFLHSQVRLMVGNLIEVGRGVLSPDDLKKMLIPDASIKSKAANIPGRGLYLISVG